MKNNLLANGLMVLIGILLLFSAVQMLGWGSAVKPLEAEPFDKNLLPSLDNVETPGQDVSEQKDYSEIAQAPLFSIDREPFIPELVDLNKDLVNELPASPLDIQVTSIVITPENSYVMIHDKVINKRLTLEQGMPLEGEQGAWFVEEIHSRLVTFAAEGQETVEMELEVFKGALAGNKRKAARAANKRRNNKNATSSTTGQTKKDSAAEIRKKIAERRAQMRADAANRKN